MELWTKWNREQLARDLADFGSVPPVLHHYTTAAGLMGIVSSKLMRATHTDFLNDTTEIALGTALCVNALQAFEGTEFAALGHLAKEGLNKRHNFDVFVACLSAEDDSLPQWTRYAADGAGYALGVTSNALSALPACRLMRVMYDKDRQAARVQDAVASAESDLAALPAELGAERDAAIRLRFSTLSSEFAMMCAVFKSATFAYENEWRLVKFVSQEDVSNTEFRDRDGMIVPYIPVSLTQYFDNMPRLIFATVKCGPKHLKAGDRGLLSFLRKHGSGAEVSASAAPLRR